MIRKIIAFYLMQLALGSSIIERPRPYSHYAPNVFWTPRGGFNQRAMVHGELEGLENRVFKGVPSLSFALREEKVKNHQKEECSSKGGALVNDECYQFIVGSDNFTALDMSFQGARRYCQEREGDIWTPDTTDPLLFAKLFKNLPAFTDVFDMPLTDFAAVGDCPANFPNALHLTIFNVYSF